MVEQAVVEVEVLTALSDGLDRQILDAVFHAQNLINSLRNRVEGFWSNVYRSGLDQTRGWIFDMHNSIKQGIYDQSDFIEARIKDASKSLKEQLTESTDDIKKAINATQNYLNRSLMQVYQRMSYEVDRAGKTVTEGLNTGIKFLEQSIIGNTSTVLSTLQDTINDITGVFGSVWDLYSALWTPLLENGLALLEFLLEAKDWLLGIQVGGVDDLIEGYLTMQKRIAQKSQTKL